MKGFNSNAAGGPRSLRVLLEGESLLQRTLLKPFDCGAAGGPRSLRVLLEGESLLNDASSITLFTIFLRKVEEYTHGEDTQSGLAVFGDVCKQTVWLAVGACQPCQLGS